MAPTLQEFNKQNVNVQQLRMDAFQPTTRRSPAANNDTINLLGTYGGALTTDADIDGAYKSITNQFSYSASSNTLDQIMAQWRENDVAGSMDSLRQVMVDPNISDDEKQSILYGFQTGQSSNRISYSVAKSALMADDGDENGEQEDMRVQIASQLDAWDNHNAWAQNTLNALNSETSPDFGDNVRNLVNSFLPFADAADQAFFENAINVEGAGGAVNTVQTLLLLGEGKERLRTTLAKIPLEERQAVIQNIVKLIKSTSGAMGDDALAVRQLAALENAIIPGAYNNTDRWADNIFSVLDDTVLLTPLSRTFRGALSGLKVADEARVAEQIIARGERVSEAPRAPLMIEYKPQAVDWASDVDNIIDNIDPELLNKSPRASSSSLTELRSLINDQINKGGGFDIDAVIDGSNLTDYMSQTQILDLRQKLGGIRDKRTAFVNGNVQPVVGTIDEVRANAVSSNVSPKSISQNYKDTNPSKAQIAHSIVVNSNNDEAAKLLYGTTRQNALAHDYLPNIGGNGRVENKIQPVESDPIPDQRILAHVKNSEGASWADAVEKAKVQQAVINDWTNTVGTYNRSNMAGISDVKLEGTDTGVRLNQVYGPKKGGFSNAFNGIDVVRAALRKYGVGDDELRILSRQADGTYAPVQKGQDLTNGDFLVQVDYDYKFDPKDVEYRGYDVSRLWKFLRIPDIPLLNKEGGVVQQIIPKSVNIDPRAFTPGVAAADRAAGIQKQFLSRANEFGKLWNKLPKDQRNRVDEYIRKANDQEIKFSIARIRGEGISEDGVEVLARWKQLQDTLGELENTDVARSLRDRGYEMFEHRASDTRVITEPMKRGSVVYGTRFFDVSDNTFKTLTNAELDELYSAGGNISRLRRVENFNGEEMEFILNRNTPDGGFSRLIRDSDRILNYRDGYYHVRYTDPYYITKMDKDGKVSVIGRAESSRDARIEAQRLNDTKDGSSYDFKRDRNDQSFDNHLDAAISSGRSAQRLRGARLERVKGANDKTLSDSGIESPIDSLTRSISSISNRVAFRNVIDSEKRRWMTQFKNHAPVKEGRGPSFPTDISEIKDIPGATEARHAYRHIEQLQDGYGNMLDDLTKGFFSSVSEAAGSKGWGWLDKMAAKASRFSPSTAGRLTAFRLFLASNPMRQLPLQSIPAIPIISSLNPTGWGRVLKQASILASHSRGVDGLAAAKLGKYGNNADDVKALIEDFELSGMSAAVNAHSYLADDIATLADKNIAQRALSIAGKPLRFTQSIGFDLGEQTLMTLVWLSERDRYLRAGKKTRLSPTDRDQVVAKARALTGDMNRGGDMPYNSNSFSIIMQFMQTPHKIASGLILGHKSLSGSERLRVAAGYTLAFGVPMLPVVDMFIDKILPPDNPEARDIIKGGLTNILLNNFLSSISGEETRVDFSGSLQPFTTEPLIEFAGNLLSMNVGEFVQDTAAVSLLADSGRIHNFAKAITDWITPGNPEDIDEVKQIGITAMQMFSGLSNTWKAIVIQDLGKITTATGGTVDQDVSYMETLMKAGGFQTMDEVHYWAGNMAKWEIDGKIQSDIEGLVDSMFTKLSREGFDVGEWEQYMKIMKMASAKFSENPAYLERVKDYYTFKMRQSPDALYRLMFMGGIYSPEEVVKVINNSNFTVEQRKTLMEIYNIAGDSYGD